MRGLTRRMVIAGPLATLAAPPARSNPDWPDRPITMLHGFPPGGPTDLLARIVDDIAKWTAVVDSAHFERI